MKLYALLILSLSSFCAHAMDSDGFIMHTGVGLMSLPELSLAAQSNLAVIKFKQATTLEKKLEAKAELEKLTAAMIALYDQSSDSKSEPKKKAVKSKSEPKKEALS